MQKEQSENGIRVMTRAAGNRYRAINVLIFQITVFLAVEVSGFRGDLLAN